VRLSLAYIGVNILVFIYLYFISFCFPAEEDDKFELESVSDDEEEGDLGLESHHGRASQFRDSHMPSHDHDGGSTIFGGTGYSGKSGRSNSRDSEDGVPGTEVSYLFVDSLQLGFCPIFG